MPRLACRACGRQVYTVAPLESLFADERRCPRCGAPLDVDRREADRRRWIRRRNPHVVPGPPAGIGERRIGERRSRNRRREEGAAWRPGG